MIKYWTIKCPHCGWTLAFGFGHPWKLRVGREIRKCWHCQVPFRTGCKEWYALNRSERWQYWYQDIPYLLGLFFAVLGLFVVLNLYDHHGLDHGDLDALGLFVTEFGPFFGTVILAKLAWRGIAVVASNARAAELLRTGK